MGLRRDRIQFENRFFPHFGRFFGCFYSQFLVDYHPYFGYL